jgi:hypothetical protein
VSAISIWVKPSKRVYFWGAPRMEMQDNYRPDSDLYIIYNVGTQFASIAPRTLHKFVSTPRRRLVSPIGQT